MLFKNSKIKTIIPTLITLILISTNIYGSQNYVLTLSKSSKLHFSDGGVTVTGTGSDTKPMGAVPCLKVDVGRIRNMSSAWGGPWPQTVSFAVSPFGNAGCTAIVSFLTSYQDDISRCGYTVLYKNPNQQPIAHLPLR